VTPEGKVKAKVRALLNRYEIEFAMPVQTGMGKQFLDFVCCWRGLRLDIETKAPNGALTPLQRATCVKLLNVRAKVFIISNEDGLAALERYLDRTSATSSFNPDACWPIPLLPAR